MTREEVFRATGPTSGSSSTVKIGATKDGKITAVKATYRLQAGAFPGSPIRGAVGCALSPYDIANVQITGFDVVTNRPKVAAYRAPGAPIGAFSVECTLDELATALSMDPLRAAPEERGQAGNQGGLRTDFPPHRLRRRRCRRPSTIRTTRRRWARTRAAASPAASGSMPAANSSATGQRQRGRHRGGRDGPSRHRRLARLDGQYRRRDAGHRLPPGAGPDRRHERRSASAR